jgi:hypothetical protein
MITHKNLVITTRQILSDKIKYNWLLNSNKRLNNVAKKKWTTPNIWDIQNDERISINKMDPDVWSHKREESSVVSATFAQQWTISIDLFVWNFLYWWP